MTHLAPRPPEVTTLFVERRDIPSIEEQYELFEQGVAYVWRRCDILNYDLTPWRDNVGIVSGTISVDAGRAGGR